MSPEIGIALRVTGPDLREGAIEALLGFGATAKWKKGQSIQGTDLLRPEDGWEYRKPARPGYAIEEATIELQQALAERSADLRRLCQECNYRVEVVCIVEMYDETAGLVLAADVAAWLAELRASLAIDTYISSR
jgi:hypothetical protein